MNTGLLLAGATLVLAVSPTVVMADWCEAAKTTVENNCRFGEQPICTSARQTAKVACAKQSDDVREDDVRQSNGGGRTVRGNAQFSVRCPSPDLRTKPKDFVYFGQQRVGSVSSVKLLSGTYHVTLAFTIPLDSMTDEDGIGLTEDSDATVISDGVTSWVRLSPGGEERLLRNGGTIEFTSCLPATHPAADREPPQIDGGETVVDESQQCAELNRSMRTYCSSNLTAVMCTDVRQDYQRAGCDTELSSNRVAGGVDAPGSTPSAGADGARIGYRSPNDLPAFRGEGTYPKGALFNGTALPPGYYYDKQKYYNCVAVRREPAESPEYFKVRVRNGCAEDLLVHMTVDGRLTAVPFHLDNGHTRVDTYKQATVLGNWLVCKNSASYHVGYNDVVGYCYDGLDQ